METLKPVHTHLQKEGIPYQVWFSLFMRTILFFIFGALVTTIFVLLGIEQPLQAAEKWWPFQAIAANIVTYLLLRNFLKKEGLSYQSLFNKWRGRNDIQQAAFLLIVAAILGAIPLFLFSYVLFGSFTPPDVMFQELPMWALILSLIIFPITNGLVETPTYIGYALPRIEKATQKRTLAIVISGLALALQHIALPIVLDGNYMLWRLLSFIPLGIALGLIFTKTKRLWPIVVVHTLMDLQLVIQLAIMTLGE